MQESLHRGIFSAELTLQLTVGNRTFQVAKASPNYIVLREPADIPAGEQGELLMTVDGKPRSWRVKLIHGAVPFSRKVKTVLES